MNEANKSKVSPLDATVSIKPDPNSNLGTLVYSDPWDASGIRYIDEDVQRKILVDEIQKSSFIYNSPIPEKEEVLEYKALSSEHDYYYNKHSELVKAISILSSYDIDVDYTELILLARDSAKRKKALEPRLKYYEAKYPNIRKYLNYISGSNYIDSYVESQWRNKERKLLNPAFDFSSVETAAIATPKNIFAFTPKY
jgi:hypothetical protein